MAEALKAVLGFANRSVEEARAHCGGVAYMVVGVEQVPGFFPHAGSLYDKGDFFEVTWNVGDLRPRELSDEFTLTIVAGTKAPEEIAAEMTASAMDRRGTRTKTEQLTVTAEAWTLDDFYNAEPH